MASIRDRFESNRCPVCGAAGCACGGPSKVIPVDQLVTVAGGGSKLFRFDLGRGRSILLSKPAAQARGLWRPELDPDSEEQEGKK